MTRAREWCLAPPSETELRNHKEQVVHKDRIAAFKLKLKAVTHFSDRSQLLGRDAPFDAGAAGARVKELRSQGLREQLAGGDDDASPSPTPSLGRSVTVG